MAQTLWLNVISDSPGNISLGIWIQSLCAAGSRTDHVGGYQVGHALSEMLDVKKYVYNAVKNIDETDFV